MTQGSSAGRNKETVVSVELQFRDLQVLSLMFGPGLAVDAKVVMDFLQSHRQHSIRFPFLHWEALVASGQRSAAAVAAGAQRFGRYVARRDFERMGIPDGSLVLNTTVNANFQLTPSYPQVLCVPSEVSDKDLNVIALFRTKRRFPVVIWRRLLGGGMLLRSSQPHVGVGRARCEEDEALLKIVSALSARNPILMICDARPRLNALANQATTSGGSENTLFYPFSVLQFGNIDNIHGMRTSYEKVLTLVCSRRDEDCDEWERKLMATGWQKHLYTILQCVRSISDWLRDGKNCLLHCSDGWDRTSMVASLVQLCMDPWYRSCEGFATLVEKDWVSYGHMFVWRNGQLGGDEKSKERSPVFFQFLSCVMQLVSQWPTAFEFGSPFLIRLHRESLSGRYGTFHANSPRDRYIEQLEEKTLPVWDAFLDAEGNVLPELRNPLYQSRDGPIMWDPNPCLMRFWYDGWCWPKLEHALSPPPPMEQQLRFSVDQMCLDFSSNALSQSALLEGRLAALTNESRDKAELLQQLEDCQKALARAQERLKVESVEMAVELILDASWSRIAARPPPPAPVQPLLPKRVSTNLRAQQQSPPPHRVSSFEALFPAPASTTDAPPPPDEELIWVPDSLALHCAICKATFTWTLRRHHCRQCGSCVCGSCSANKMIVKAGADPQRVCDTCFSDRFFGKRK